jgi:hypothetical protein
MYPVDVLVLGGGIQGLVLLDELTRQGYAAALVTNSELGSGQTLHSHGFLNSGYLFLRPQLRATLNQSVLPLLQARGLQIYGDDQWFAVAPPGPLAALRQAWTAHGYEYEEVTADALPSGFQEGELFRSGAPTQVIRLKEYNFPKRQLVRLLSEHLHDRIIRGEVVAFHCVPGDHNQAGQDELRTSRVETTEVQVHASRDKVVLAPKAVILAAGAGTKRLVKSLVAEPSFARAVSAEQRALWQERVTQQIGKIKYAKTHMICVRAPQGVLPAASAIVMSHGFMLVGHVNRDHDGVGYDAGDKVTWYVTPMDPDVTLHEDVPDNARAEVNRAVVVQGFNNLLRVYPPLWREVVRPESPVRIAVYAGYLQNVVGETLMPLCERVEGTSNVLMALPSGLLGAWVNSQTALTMLRSQVKASGWSQSVPGTGQGVRAGLVNELTDEAMWMTGQEFVRTYPGITV